MFKSTNKEKHFYLSIRFTRLTGLFFSRINGFGINGFGFESAFHLMLQNIVAPNIGQKLSKSVAYKILGAGLYTTYCGERVLVAIRFNATFLSLRPYCEKNMYLILEERCTKSNNIWLRALMQSDCLHSSLFFEHSNNILLCDRVLGRHSVC